MIFLRLIPVILSFLILGAHFYRLSLNSLVLLSIVFPFLLLIKKAWIPKLFQATLILAALEWLRSLYVYIQAYEDIGKSWTILLMIIGGVTLFTLFSALVFKNKAIRKRYN